MNKMGKDISLAATILRNGGVVAFPTETVMGLGVVFDNEDAYNRLNIIKGRPESKPYTMMLKSPEDIAKYAYINGTARIVINKFLPGPLTILLKAKEDVPTYVTHNTGVIGIRVPQYPLLNELLNQVDKPLLAPSANPSGKEPGLTSDKVAIYFADTLDYIIDYNSQGDLPSTIVDLTQDEIKVVREGRITLIDLLNAIKEN